MPMRPAYALWSRSPARWACTSVVPSGSIVSRSRVSPVIAPSVGRGRDACCPALPHAASATTSIRNRTTRSIARGTIAGMLRAILVGLLSLSAVNCKSHDATVTAQPGVAAGSVVQVSGTVTLHHGDAARPLAKGDTVEGDDIVETGADGSVVIELAHN